MEIVKLNTVCDLKNGFAFKSKDYVDESNTLSVRMSSIRPGGNFDLEHNKRYLPDNYAELYSDYLLVDGDIVIAMTDLAGDPKILGVPTIVKTNGKKLLQNQRVGKLIVKDKSKVHIPFLQYALNRPVNKTYYKKFAGGGLQINVGKKEILGNTIPLPPLDQQKQIASILDTADAYRQKTKALIEKYDALTQSLFLDMFGDFVLNPYGFFQSTLGELLPEKNSIKCGPFGSQLKIGEYIDEGIPVYGIDNVATNRFKQSKPKFISESKYQQLSAFDVNYKDVLISRTGTVGRTCLAPNVDKAVIGPNLLKVRIQNDKLLPIFLSFAFNYSPSIIRQIEMFSPGATVAVYNTGNLKKLKILVPPIKLQSQFVDRFKEIDKQKALAQQELDKADNLFNSLLQKAFKGELV